MTVPYIMTGYLPVIMVYHLRAGHISAKTNLCLFRPVHCFGRQCKLIREMFHARFRVKPPVAGMATRVQLFDGKSNMINTSVIINLLSKIL